MDTSFQGQADYTLDAKNRLTVPARYRGLLEGGLVVTKDIEPCVAIWPTEGFADFRRAALEGVHPMSPRARKIRTFFASNSLPSTLDSAGRVPLQSFHLEHGGIEREVTVVGVDDHLQVWNREAWDAHSAQLDREMAELSAAFDTFPAS